MTCVVHLSGRLASHCHNMAAARTELRPRSELAAAFTAEFQRSYHASLDSLAKYLKSTRKPGQSRLTNR
jgi:hypothetical protein